MSEFLLDGLPTKVNELHPPQNDIKTTFCVFCIDIIGCKNKDKHSREV